MKKVKYIFSAILIFILLSFIGELYVWNLMEFNFNYNGVEVYLSDDINRSDFIDDIIRLANENDVEIFLTERTVENIFSETVRIFGTHNIESKLQESSQIVYGTHSSIILGHISVYFYSLEYLEAIPTLGIYNLVGNDDNQRVFLQNLSNIYGNITFFESHSLNEIAWTFSITWLVVIILLLLMTLFDVALMKKEVMIRLVSGERLRDFVTRRIVQDLIFYVLMFISLFLMLSPFSHISYLRHITTSMFILFLLLNSLLYLNVFSVDFRKDVSTKKSAKTILSISYVYKVGVLIFVLLSVAGNSHFIWNALNYHRQNDFFIHHQNYHFPQIFSEHENIDVSIELKLDFHKEFSAQGRVLSLIDLKSESDFELLYANRGAISILKEQIEDFDGDNLEEIVYFLIPKAYKENSLILREINNIWSFYFRNEFDYKVYYYSDYSQLIGISATNEINSRLLRNPIIILNNMSYEQYRYFNHGIIFFTNSSMVKINQEELERFLEENAHKQAVGYMTNAYENYIHHLEMAQRNMIFGIVSIGSLLMINSFVTASMMKYEYDINAKELTLKKILGYKLVERYRKIFMITIGSGFVGLIIAFTLAILLGTSVFATLLVAILILLIETFFIFIHVRKVEKSNIQKIIKGGSL